MYPTSLLTLFQNPEIITNRSNSKPEINNFLYKSDETDMDKFKCI